MCDETFQTETTSIHPSHPSHPSIRPSVRPTDRPVSNPRFRTRGTRWARSDGWMDGRPAARYDDGTGRVDDDGCVTLTRAHTVRVRRSISVSLTYARASERARRRRDDDDDDDPAVRWRRMDGWTNGTRAVYPSIYLSFHRSIDRSMDRSHRSRSRRSRVARRRRNPPFAMRRSIALARARPRGSTGAARLTRSPPIDPRSLFRFHSTREKCPLLSPLAFPRAP